MTDDCYFTQLGNSPTQNNNILVTNRPSYRSSLVTVKLYMVLVTMKLSWPLSWHKQFTTKEVIAISKRWVLSCQGLLHGSLIISVLISQLNIYGLIYIKSELLSLLDKCVPSKVVKNNNKQPRKKKCSKIAKVNNSSSEKEIEQECIKAHNSYLTWSLLDPFESGRF